jgi:general secretion pathway protein G
LIPRVTTSSQAAKEKCCHHNRAEIDISTERYYIHTGSWPADNLSDIGVDPNYFPEGVPACPVSGQAYRLDSVTHRVVGHTGPGGHSP